MRTSLISVTVAALASLAAAPAFSSGGQEEAAATNAYFGELHIHTALSTDAFANGTRKHPMTAYRFAQGDPVTLSSGENWQLSRPLDFVALTDHAESFGDLSLCLQPDSPVYNEALCRGMRTSDPTAMGRVIGGWAVKDARRSPETCGEDGELCLAAERGTWSLVQDAANRSNIPGKFTALIGYEYSPVLIKPDSMSKIHRNVIFRGDVVPDRAFSAYDGTAEEMHAWIEEACEAPCQALTIPHNTNASSSHIFWDGKNSDGSPWTKEVLERRARLEPLVEIYQGKGASECHIGIGLADEECDFEKWVRNCGPGERVGCATATDMVRDTLVRGLRVEQEWGVNPFKLGFIGSTDSHLGTPGATEEDNYKGQLGNPDGTPQQRLGDSFFPTGDEFVAPKDGGWGFGGPTKFSPGGLAAVWAPENTREAIWDALARRETFATSGTRIRVRFFASFDFADDAHEALNATQVGYRNGVPMGGELSTAPEGRAPRFLVRALRDPEGAPLQKLQIIKGWVRDGKEQARVYDVACSDGLQPDVTTGMCADNGARVDMKSCAIDLDKGDAELATTWTDPDFDPATPALYYVRVLENPVCRWSTHDALRIGAELAPHVPATIKERAWTAPIWYSP